MTGIQESILDALAQSCEHMSAEQILDWIRHTNSTASLSTVYRNLNAFAQAGKIRRIQRAAGADYYEKKTDPHDHAYCICCGKVMDVRIPKLREFLEQSFVRPIHSVDLVIHFECSDCAREQESKKSEKGVVNHVG